MTATVHDVAAAVLARVGPTEAMKLQKLVYYSQAWHLALTDDALFDDDIQAWNRGPVVDALFQKHRGKRMVHRWETGHPGRITGTSEQVLALVCQVYGGLSGDELSEMTHQELPWRQARGTTPDGEYSRAPIVKETMKRFYRQRQLAGRSVADLVSGGLAGLQNPQITVAERRRLLADIRAEYRQQPSHGAGLPEPVGVGFRQDGDHDASVRVVENRKRPARGRLR